MFDPRPDRRQKTRDDEGRECQPVHSSPYEQDQARHTDDELQDRQDDTPSEMAIDRLSALAGHHKFAYANIVIQKIFRGCVSIGDNTLRRC